MSENTNRTSAANNDTNGSEQTADEVVDLLVIGSGAGAMTAGIVGHDAGAKVLLIEKGDQYGGSSAMSGGGLWVPCNHLARAAGIKDDEESAWAYLKGCVGDAVADERLRAYLREAPEMVRYLCENTHLDFVPLGEYADYYSAIEGSRPGGRSLDPVAFDGRLLGEEFSRMRESAPQQQIMGRISMTIPEARVALSRTPGWVGTLARLFFGYLSDLGWRLKSKRDRRLAMGNALVGMLRRSLMDRDVPLWLNTAAKGFIVENDRVVGTEIVRNGKPMKIHARRGVLLAAGGFEANQAMREEFLPKPTSTEWSVANPNNTGDVIRMGRDLGADLGLMDDGWWGPVFKFPNQRAHFAVIELSLPGSILVNKYGKRFVNEACPYGEKVVAIYRENDEQSATVPSFLIFDSNFRKKYPIGPMLPGAQQPDFMVPKEVREHVLRAKTLDELAQMAGIDAAGLKETVRTMNGYARTGKDLEFGRGDTVFDRYYGDAAVTPNPNLGELGKAPFYAIRTYPGELGTKGGLMVDEHARVVDKSGKPIEGLYAAGNCSSSVMGRSYPGAGATLGPATTFSYIAARHALAK